MNSEKPPLDMEKTLRNYTEVVDPKATTSYKLGVKNQQKLDKIRQMVKKLKGIR